MSPPASAAAVAVRASSEVTRPSSAPMLIPRQLDAALRWRTHRYLAKVKGRLSGALRLFPVLLHATFDHGALRKEAAGVKGARFRSSWSKWARAFELPPPSGARRMAAMIEAVLAFPQEGRVDLVIVERAGINASDALSLRERLAAVKATLGFSELGVSVTCISSGDVAAMRSLGHQAAAFGLLIAGELAAEFWKPAWNSEASLTSEEVSCLLEVAPTSLSFMLVAFSLEGRARSPVHTMCQALAGDTQARKFADLEELSVVWAIEATGSRQMIDGLRQLASGGDPVGGVFEVMTIGRQMALACARSASQLKGKNARLRKRLRDEIVGPGVPRVLLATLKARLTTATIDPEPQLAEDGKNAFEVRCGDGAVLGRGLTVIQAQMRAQWLLSQVETKFSPSIEEEWLPLQQRLGQPCLHPELVLSIVPNEVTGYPLDPLNRGESRAAALSGAVAMWRSPGGRPSARWLHASSLAELLAFSSATSQRKIEIVTAHTSGRPVVTRLVRMLELLQSSPASALALEIEGEVLVRGRTNRRFHWRRAARRPRDWQVDPESPDLSLAPERWARGVAPWSIPGVIECRVWMINAGTAALLYVDADRKWFFEEIDALLLRDHLLDGQRALRQHIVPSPIVFRMEEELEPVLRRSAAPDPKVTVALTGALPLGLVISVGQEQFGAKQALGWRDAAQAISSRWPTSARGSISLAQVDVVGASGRATSPLLRLYARSVALRRLSGFLKEQTI